MSLEKIFDGYQRFVANTLPAYRELYQELITDGQHPHTLVITCSDSRINPGLVFDAKPGELFVVRNVGNLVPEYAEQPRHCETGAAIEFAVRVLRVSNIVVLGHQACGACAALFANAEDLPGPNIQHWLEANSKTRDQVLEQCGGKTDDPNLARITETQSLKNQLANLETHPVVASGLKEESLNLLAAYYQIDDGVVEYYDPEQDAFRPMAGN